MDKSLVQYIILFFVLLLLQVLLFNNLVIFHTAVCFIFIYLIIRLPLSLSVNWLLTIAFLMGFVIDIFSDTPGVNSLCSVILAALRRPVFFLYVAKDDKTKSETPGIATMGWTNYSKYLLTMIAIFCLSIFTVDFFSFADIQEILVMAGSSLLFTFPVIIATDCFIDSINAKRS